jgi:hypothetical protein
MRNPRLMPMVFAVAASAVAVTGARQQAGPASSSVIESAYLSPDVDLTTDPKSALWADAPRVVMDRDYFGQPVGDPPTEVRSRWTEQHLYLLYINQYDELNLKPDPTPAVETPRLWNWDVSEAFIGSDFERIGRYKEFQVSPQGEWVDLDIDRDNSQAQQGMKWNSGYTVAASIDAPSKIWYGAMRIPFSAIDTRRPEKGRELRIGLYRIAGAAAPKKHYAWQPTGIANFHVPKAFGILRLR